MLDRIKNEWNNFYSNILGKKRYYMPIVLVCVIAYAFNVMHRTVGVDDLSYDIFGGDRHYAFLQYRWGIYVLSPLLKVKEYTPFIGRFFALVFLVLSAFLLSFLLYLYSERKNNVFKYTIFSCFYLTYPLINEVWEFNWLSMPINADGVPFFMCLATVALIYNYFAEKKNVVTTIITGLILTPVMAGYESVVFAYISLVFVVLFLKNLKDSKNNWFLDGIGYALPLIVALVLRYVIGYLLIIGFNVQGEILDTAGRMNWIKDGVLYSVKRVLFNGWYYLIRGLSYMPIAEFDLALLVFIVVVIYLKINNHKNTILLGIFLVLSLFLLSFVQGEYLNYRAAQTIQLFTAFAFYLLVDVGEGWKYKNIICILLSVLCIRQSVCLHTLLALNNQRSDNEASLVQNIGYRLYSEFDMSKTVIFCGEYQLGNFIQDQITVSKDSYAYKLENQIRDLIGHDEGRYYTEYVSTNINSYLNLQMDADNGQRLLKKYLSYYGYDINVLENLSDKEEDKLKGYYELIAKKEKMNTYDIKDMGEYILVYLGPTKDRISKLKYTSE